MSFKTGQTRIDPTPLPPQTIQPYRVVFHDIIDHLPKDGQPAQVRAVVGIIVQQGLCACLPDNENNTDA